MEPNRIKEYTLTDGTVITAYVPENVSNDTPVFYYSYVVGSNYNEDSVWQGMEDDMAKYDGDAIVIIPHDKRLQIGGESTNTHKYQMNATEAFETVKKDLGIETTQFINGGFSAGFGYGTRTLAHYLQENPNADRQVLLAVDGVINPTANLQQSELDALKANNTLIISFTQQKNHNYQANLFKSTGLPILYVVDNSIPENTPDSKYWGIHDQVAIDFFDKGLYEQVINFALGKSDLTLPDGYSLRYYDPNTGEIVKNITPDQAAELLGITSYDNLSKNTQIHLATLGDISIKSNDKTLESYLNAIRKEIRKTNFLTTNFNEAQYISTTKVPTDIPEMVNSYFAMTASLLNRIANKTVAIARIAHEIEILDNNMSKQAELLNNAPGLYVAATPPEPSIIINNLTNNDVILNPPPDDVVVDQLTNKEEPKPDDIPSNKGNETPSNPQGTTPQTQPVIPPTLPGNNDEDETPSTPEEKPDDNGTDGQTPSAPEQQPEKPPIEEQFPEYDELYTTNDKVVFNYNDKYKVVIHHENGKITGVEHYYDYKTTEEATKAAEQLKLDYKDTENFDKVIQKDRYVKVLFKEDMYKNITLDNFKEKYKDLDEVLEQL